MTEIVLFGGTTEGRELCELLSKKQIETIVCIATEYGEMLLTPQETLHVHMGRLDKAAMEKLFKTENPRLVIDATHPYANQVSDNISTACKKVGTKHLRLLRETLDNEGCVIFPHMNGLISWLKDQRGTIFSTLGTKEAAALSVIEGYRERLWLRILPDTAGLSACLRAGFPARHVICMQGPFSRELNAAMFRETKADILLTKESGLTGGYLEKIDAARECAMTVALLSRPSEETGLTLSAMLKLIEEDAL